MSPAQKQQQPPTKKKRQAERANNTAASSYSGFLPNFDAVERAERDIEEYRVSTGKSPAKRRYGVIYDDTSEEEGCDTHQPLHSASSASPSAELNTWRGDFAPGHEGFPIVQLSLTVARKGGDAYPAW